MLRATLRENIVRPATLRFATLREICSDEIFCFLKPGGTRQHSISQEHWLQFSRVSLEEALRVSFFLLFLLLPRGYLFRGSRFPNPQYIAALRGEAPSVPRKSQAPHPTRVHV